jgi:hypothetical protein
MNRAAYRKMKAIFVGPQGIRAGWRFAMFVFLLFGFSKLLFWLLTLFHYQEHVGWFPTDFLLDGALSFGAALLAAEIMAIVIDGVSRYTTFARSTKSNAFTMPTMKMFAFCMASTEQPSPLSTATANAPASFTLFSNSTSLLPLPKAAI